MNARARGLLTVVGIAAGTFLLIELILPKSTPMGVIVFGALLGLLTALTAAGLVLIYRTQRIINFSQIALGSIGATILFEMTTRGILPYAAALPIGLLSGPFVGIVAGIITVVLFWKHPRLVATVMTILLLALIGQGQLAVGAAFRKPEEITGPTQPFLGPFPDHKILMDGFAFRTAHLIGAVLAIGLMLGMAAFFRRTRFGIAVRASAENADRASLLGINVKLLQVGVWGMVGLLGSAYATLALPMVGYQPGQGLAGGLSAGTALLEALAAAVLARMTSIPMAMLAAFTMAILKQAVSWSYPTGNYFPLALFVIILGGILLQRRRLIARQVETSATWQQTKEVRATPREMLRVPAVALARRFVAVAVLAAALAWPWFGGADLANFGGEVWIVAMVGISLVILTGWTGQISLGQFALVAVGAFAAGVMTGRWGWSFWLAVPLASVLGAAFAVLVGLPALRIRGLFLAVTTFALAVAMPILLFRDELLGRFLPEQIRRPRLFFLNFNDERSFYYFVLACFAVVVLVVRTLRRSRTGRVLIALRDDEHGAQSFGIDIVRTRLSAFALSGFIAAFAGALFAHHQLGLNAQSYAVGASIQIFISSIVGGVSTVVGPVLGVLYFLGVGQLPVLGRALSGVSAILVLVFIPGGLTQIVFGLRDAVLRVIALRNRIVVPSLFADYSPEAWERQQAPLAPPIQGHGLAALGADRRYSLPSRLWGSPEAVEQALALEAAGPVWKAGPR